MHRLAKLHRREKRLVAVRRIFGFCEMCWTWTCWRRRPGLDGSGGQCLCAVHYARYANFYTHVPRVNDVVRPVIFTRRTAAMGRARGVVAFANGGDLPPHRKERKMSADEKKNTHMVIHHDEIGSERPVTPDVPESAANAYKDVLNNAIMGPVYDDAYQSVPVPEHRNADGTVKPRGGK